MENTSGFNDGQENTHIFNDGQGPLWFLNSD